MNIFYLDHDTLRCAQYHCDKHVVKMILEYAQILSTAHRLFGDEKSLQEYDSILYKKTHVNHPSSKWARHTAQHYTWLYELFSALCHEYTYRYNKVHLTQQKLGDFLSNIPKYIDYNGTYSVPLCMPDDCKLSDPIESYRKYYKEYKKEFAKWTVREIPYWYKVH